MRLAAHLESSGQFPTGIRLSREEIDFQRYYTLTKAAIKRE
jgi:hypothetical protein